MNPVDAATIKRVRAQLVGDADLAGRVLARRLSQQTDSWFESLGAELPPGWALVATGGYARGVLTPGSDIDVVLLHPGKVTDSVVRDLAEGLWYPMWDAGLKLSPAAHSVKSLLHLAADDLDTATSVLSVRCLAGDVGLASEVQRDAIEQWRRRPFVWLQRLLTSGQLRWDRFGDIASLLEPDLKEGRGGLRDHDMIRWALQVDRPDVTAALEDSFDDLAGPAELLLAARCELHRATGRATNTLQLQDQERVADAMGYADADVLMQNLAGAAHAIEWATERFWRRTERLIRSSGRATRRTHVSAVLSPGVVVVDDEAHIAADADVDEQSYVFRFAASAAHAGVPMGGRSLRMLASRGVPPGEEWTDATRRAFISLLGSGSAVMHTVESLERYGLFSRYLPEWRAVRSLPQRNAFHTYTVDRHLLQTVANASEFVRDVSRPDLLLLGALLHDLGKGYPGDHTEAGVVLVDTVSVRMGLAVDDARIVRAMVEHHLLLPETATRRDLSDPRTTAIVAEAVGDLGILELLDALTEADSKATGPAAWSPWKRSLIDELVAAVAGVLRGGPAVTHQAPDPDRLAHLARSVEADGSMYIEQEDTGDVEVLRIASRDRAGLFAQIAGVLALHGLDVIGASAATRADGVAVDEFRVVKSTAISPNWDRIEQDLRGVAAGEVDIASRLEQRLRTAQRRNRPSAATPPRFEVLLSNDASESTTVVEVRAADAPAVLYRLARALTALGLDVRSAVASTLGHELVDVFYVRTADSSPGQVPESEFERVRSAMLAALGA